MKKTTFRIHQWLRSLVMMVAMLTAMSANAYEWTRTYTFTGYGPADAPAPFPSGDYGICNGQNPWGMSLHSGTCTFDDGLYFKGVSKMPNWVQMFTTDYFDSILRIKVNMAMADAGEGCEKITISASNGYNDLEVQPYESYQGLRSNLVTQDYVFEVGGSGQVYFTFFAEQKTIDVVIKSITVTYEGPEPTYYNLWVDGIEVTSANKDDVKGDGSVSFDGNKRLILNGTWSGGITSAIPDLEVYLKGDNLMSSEGSGIEFVEAEKQGTLTFLTNGNEPGRLSFQQYGNTAETAPNFTIADAFRGYNVFYRNNLTATLEIIGKNQDVPMVTVGVPLNPIVDESPDTQPGTEITIDYASNPGGVATNALTNYIANNVLYTLYDTQTPGAADDGYADGQLMLRSTMTDAEVAAIHNKVKSKQLTPGMDDYAQQYKGLTFIVPAGTGVITVGAQTDPGFEFRLKVGAQDAVAVVNQADNGGQVCEIPYAVSAASYVYLYLAKTASAAPANDGTDKIGPKSGVGGGLGSLGVTGNNIVSPSQPSSNYLLCTADMLYQGSKGGIVVSNSDVTDIDAAAFAHYANAPHRALSTKNIPYVDLTQTAITGMDISRSYGAFAGFGEHTIIYAPAGNTTSDPNVVIGGVCDELTLGTANHCQYKFAMPDNVPTFTAGKAKSNLQLTGQPQIVCLPFAVKTDNLDAAVYEYGELTSDNKVLLKGVEKSVLPAHMPHVIKGTQGGTLPTQTSVDVYNVTLVTYGSLGEVGLYGSYDYATDYSFSGWVPDGNKFVKVDAAHPVYVYEGYLGVSVDAGVSSLDIVYDDSALGVENITTTAGQQSADWYTLDGRRLTAKSTHKGLYIHEGRKVVVK